MKIIWTPLALDRVTEIAQYIAEENHNTAILLTEQLFTRVSQLSSFPESGQVVPELDKPDIRQLVSDSYRIIYRIREKDIVILTVRHHRQNLSDSDV